MQFEREVARGSGSSIATTESRADRKTNALDGTLADERMRAMANRVFTPRKGGQELPDDVQDRPEQNRGYDDAVRGAERAKQQQDSEGAEGDEFEDDEDEDVDEAENGDTV